MSKDKNGEDKHWIKGAIKKPGALRETLGVKKGKKITKAQLKKAAASKSGKTRKRASLAATLIKIARGRG